MFRSLPRRFCCCLGLNGDTAGERNEKQAWIISAHRGGTFGL
jgi:hypothetical protein